MAAAALTVLALGACGRPAPANEAQAGAAPDPAAAAGSSSPDSVDAAVPSDQSESANDSMSGSESDPMAGGETAGGNATEDGEAAPADGAEQAPAAAPVLTADSVVGVVDPTPGRAGVKVTSQSPIVAPSPTTAPPTVAQNSPVAADGVHVVQPGDTLSGIAEIYGVPVQSIADANGLVDVDNLKLGQELQIPAAN